MSAPPPDGTKRDMVLAVVSEPDDAGRFRLDITLEDETLRSLDFREAQTYVFELMYAVACAEYDAAVLAQLTTVTGLDQGMIGRTIGEMRMRRRPILAAATAPLVLEPIVAASDRKPRLLVWCGAGGWQWDTADARQHALQIMEVAVAAGLDTAYLAYLQSDMGLEEVPSRGFVAMLRDHRPDWQEVPAKPAG